jgi:glycosyltransferase involved in cell wall biosynthesis
MRWFTCTPKHFVGNQSFMDRDSGLLCRGFEALGGHTRAVQLAPSAADDDPLVLRAEADQMTDPVWWKNSGADGVVLFSYGSLAYQNIASAIVDAGLKLVQMTDTHGVISPWADASAQLRIQWHYHWNLPMIQRLARVVASLPPSYLWKALVRDPRRVRMMLTGDFICGATPDSTSRYQRMIRCLGGSQATEKVRHVPIPTNVHFRWGPGTPKSDEVVAVGRWDSVQKRTPLLLETIQYAVGKRSGTTFAIYGGITPEIERWHTALPMEQQNRVRLHGKVPNAALVEAYSRARVMLVSAAYEGCHIASAEVLCCGASVVGCQSPFLCAIEWHISHNSGRLAARATGRALGETLLAELADWDAGLRNPAAISQFWTRELHTDRVAARILKLFGETPLPDAP